MGGGTVKGHISKALQAHEDVVFPLNKFRGDSVGLDHQKNALNPCLPRQWEITPDEAKCRHHGALEHRDGLFLGQWSSDENVGN
jgi:hypothetical protein